MAGTALLSHSGLEVSRSSGFWRYIACVTLIAFSSDCQVHQPNSSPGSFLPGRWAGHLQLQDNQQTKRL
jgi:hypothetical protein